jgi:uncharacterized Zn finger protein
MKAAIAAAATPRFDADALREFAGERVFARGEDYYGSGAVQLLALEPDRVFATVSDTQDYTITLTGGGLKFEGSCSCPAFAERGSCKHIVAAALAVNAAVIDEEPGGFGSLSRIRAYLKAKSTDALAEMILDMAERDTVLFRKLDMAAAAAQESGQALEARLIKSLDAATRTHGFIAWREASGWVAGVEDVLDMIAGLACDSRAGLALKLAERAIDRIEVAMNDIDDSDGHCGGLLARARDIHLAAARRVRPSPEEFASHLFTREMSDGYGTFDRALRHYADVLGEEGLAEYQRLAAAAWDELPSRVPGSKEKHEYSSTYNRLAAILDYFAERDGDTSARIALRTKDLSSPWSYYQLAEFCLSHGRNGEALKWADEGLWQFEEGGADERLLSLAVKLLSEACRAADAETHLWRAFEKRPSLDLYKRLAKLTGKAARERAVNFLEARCSKERGTRWHYPADLLVLVLIEENMFASWNAVRKHGVSMGVKETLARKSEADFPQEALEVYVSRVAELAESGANTAYRQAAELVAHMATMRSGTEQAAYILELRTRFRRKRNFMKLLAP